MFVSATDSNLNVEIKEHSLLESFFVHVIIIIIIIFSTISSTDEPSCLTDPLQTELMLHRGQRSEVSRAAQAASHTSINSGSG